MKLKMTCPKCGSTSIAITSEELDGKTPIPMYKCNKCGYKNRLFPKVGENKREKETVEEKEIETEEPELDEEED